MATEGEPIVIVLAEDDEDDYILTRDALEKAQVANELHWVKDGQELLDYLRHDDGYADPRTSPTPSLILLDLNMPRLDGRDALKEIKSDPKLRRIPVVVLTTSSAEEDIIRTYDLGVNSFVQKPMSFEEFIRCVNKISEYWFQIVRLPTHGHGDNGE